jgi:hypothetical protein
VTDARRPGSRPGFRGREGSEPRQVIDLPLIACSLDAGSQKQRLADWSSLLRQAACSQDTGNGVRYRFLASDQLESRLRALAAAEKACCAFLDLDVVRTGDELVLTVTAPPQAADALRFMFPAR